LLRIRLIFGQNDRFYDVPVAPRGGRPGAQREALDDLQCVPSVDP